MADSTNDKAAQGSTNQSSAAPARDPAAAAARESAAADSLATQRLGALERPNTTPAEPRREMPDSLTNLHSGSRIDPAAALQGSLATGAPTASQPPTQGAVAATQDFGGDLPYLPVGSLTMAVSGGGGDAEAASGSAPLTGLVTGGDDGIRGFAGGAGGADFAPAPAVIPPSGVSEERVAVSSGGGSGGGASSTEETASRAASGDAGAVATELMRASRTASGDGGTAVSSAGGSSDGAAVDGTTPSATTPDSAATSAQATGSATARPPGTTETGSTETGSSGSGTGAGPDGGSAAAGTGTPATPSPGTDGTATTDGTPTGGGGTGTAPGSTGTVTDGGVSDDGNGGSPGAGAGSSGGTPGSGTPSTGTDDPSGTGAGGPSSGGSSNGSSSNGGSGGTGSSGGGSAPPTPTLTLLPGQGDEDTPLSVTIQVPADGAGNTTTVTVTGLPAGASLSAGTNNGDGSWTLSPGQLSGLTLSPPTDFHGAITLGVTAVTTGAGGAQSTATGTLGLTVDPVADAPTLTVGVANAPEGQPVALTIGAALATPADGETLSVTISGVPAGATLSAGTDRGNGVWSLSPDQLTGLTLTPATGFHGVFDLTVTATATLNGTESTRSLDMPVTVSAASASIPDAPTLSVAAASGVEDQAIALTISGALVSPAAGEVLSIVIAGVPAGAVLSAGSDNGDGTWTLSVADLSGLTLTPPSDFSGSLGLTVTATASVNGTQASHSEALTVTVASVADAPTLSVAAASGSEDQAIALSISGALVSAAAGEVLSVVIAGVPAGAVLSAGSDNGDGTWTLTVGQLSGLMLTPPSDFSGSLGLTVTATASVNGTQASHSEALTVSVAAVADAPTLSVAAASGSEDQAIALSISGALVSPAAGEVLSVVIAGVPAGAVLSAGSDNGDGTWTLTAGQLSGLTLTPPTGFSGSLGLTVTATASVNGTQASHSEALTVSVAAVADAPTLSVTAASGSEDQAIALSISGALVSPAAGEVLSVVIAGVPAGAVLSAGSDNGDGTWTLTAGQLSGLTLTPPTGFSGSLGLTVTATASVNGTQASHSEALTVSVAAVADAPTLSVTAASGSEDQAIALSISGALVSPAAGEVLSIVIAGVPAGAVLSAGSDNGDGTWTLSVADLSGLTLTPPADFSGSLGLTVTATASVNGTQASHSEALTVNVAAVADAPTLSVAAASGVEDQAIALSISGALVSPAAGEVLSIVIAGVPAGAVLSAGSDNGDGTWTLSVADLSGLTLTPPTGFSGSLGLTVTATSSVNGTQASHSEALTVSVAAVADAPTLSVTAASGSEDQAIALSISGALVSPAAGEVLSVVIAGVPAGAVLSAGSDNGDGTWTLTAGQLSGLTLTPPTGFSGSLGLTVTATASVNGTQASHSEALTVNVAAVADAPTLSVAAASGSEDQAIALSISGALVSPAAGEVLSVVIAGVPAGAVLSAGSDNGDGTWTLSVADLSGLTLTPPADFSGSLGLTVTATASVNGTQASHSEALTVNVAAVADAPTLSVAAASGSEDQAIALSISGALVSPAAGEVLSIVIAGVPAGAVLSAGIHNSDGTWTLTAGQLSGLTLTPPTGFSGSLGLTVTATASVNGTQASHSEALTVSVAAVADAPTLSVTAASGSEDQAIALSISGALVSPAAGEVLSVVIAGVPAGAVLSAGSDNGDGTWTLTAGQLSGLTLTPPTGFSGSLGLTVTATASVNGTQASHSEALTVSVAAVADAPTLSVTAASGSEDQAIALSISGALVSPAAGEVLSVVIAGVPAGAVLSAGSDNGDGTWTLTAGQLSGLTLTPPTGFSGSLGLTVTATASVNGTQASHSEALTVSVAAVADAPTLSVAAASGVEDQAIALSISGALVSPAAGEVLSVVIAGVPAGAVLSAGIHNSDGTWTLTVGQLSGLTLTPPTGFSGSLGLTVTATSSVNGTQASHSEALTVSVAAVADAPTLSVAAASGSEDQAIALSISGALVSAAAGEVLSVVIAGVPAGAVLSAGSDNGDGTWTLTVGQLSGLTLTPPTGFSGSLGLTVTATASVNGTQASHSEALTVSVAAVADAPTLSVTAASGVEDQAIALSISGALVSAAAGEVLSIVIAGVPAGAVLSAGSDNGDGTWTLSVADLSGLTLTPPTGFSGSLGLTVTATSSVNGTQASHSEALTVSVAAVADAPTLSVTAASGSEDQAIALSISGALVSPAAGEVLSVVIAGVPAGAVLSAGSDNGDGTWTLSVADLSGLTLTPPADFSGSLGLTVTATASVNGTQASHSEALTVNVAAVADAPTLSVAAASGSEDQAIALSISGALVSPAAGEVLSIVIAGVPAGAVLSAGIHNSDGTWTLTAGQLSGLTLTPPTGFSGSLGLTVTATASVNGTQASHSEALTVSVAAVADAPTLSVAAASGSEDQAIALSISGALVSPAAGEVLSVVIAGVPAGAVLSAGSDNGDGTWTLTVGQLSGLTLTPPTGFSGSLGLTVTATASVNGTQASHSEALTVSVAAVADAPTLSVTAASGVEDQAIALSISGALVSAAAGEVLSVVIAGVPAGAVLSAGIHNSDGTWTLTAGQLSGLTLTPPSDFSGSLGLTVTATSSVNGTQASHSEALTVSVAAVADAPTLSVAAASGSEDQAIALSISGALVSAAAGEVLSVVIAGVPAGAVLSAGSDNGDGTWTLTVGQLSGLTLTPPTGFSGSLGLTVTATASVNGTQASHSEALTVSVAAVADAPTLSVTAASGSEDQAIALSISGALVSPAAGEVLSVVIAGVPAGAVLSAGSDNGDGTWTLSVADLSGLTLTPPSDFSGSLGLTVTATSSVNGTQASHSEALTVSVAAVADAPTLSVTAASGSEDQAIALSISGALVSPAAGEVLSVVIAGVPTGAVLSAGSDNGDGTWTLSVADLSGLTLTPPADFSGSLGLTVTATASVNGTQASHSEALTVNVAAVADAPTLSVAAASGSEDQAIALSISGALVSPAAGEVLSIVIAGVPAGAVLSAGIHNSDGTWTLTAGQLSGLTLTPPTGFSGSLGLTVTATASVNGTQASHSEALTVSVAAVADAPTLSVAAASGSEDQAIALSISGALVSPAAGEVLSVVIAGVPAGAVLSAGSDNGDGTWTLTVGQLSGLTLTPPSDFSGSLGLTVTATASVNGTQASHSEALTVSVAAVADAPTLSVTAASGSEDQAIALSISGALVSPAAGEVLSIVIAGVPAGAVLSAGSDNGDGTWTLSVADLSGLTLTPPADFSGSLGLTVTATASVNGTQASHSEALTVNVAAVADAPTLSVAAASGVEDQAIALSISGALVSPAAGEVLSIVIAGVPAGAVLSAGSDNGDGTWTLSVADLSGLTLTPPTGFSGSLGLTVTATSSVNGTQASHSEALTVSVAAVADAPTLSVTAASGSEDQAIALSISGALVSPAAGEVLSIVIAGVPAGAVLSAGSDNGDGTWTLSVADLSGLTLTPPTGFSGSLGLTVTATSSVNGTQASHSEALTVSVAAVADAPTLSVTAASGSEDQAIALSISGALVSPAAGEVLSIVIAGVPAGAVLSAGSDNGDGTWTLSVADLSGLTLTPPADFSGSLGLTVTATASVNGTQASHSEALTVNVAAVADAPTLSVAAASGSEDQAIALSISGALVSPAAGEVLSIVIAGVPAGAVLSAGIHNSDGTWTLTAGQLSGLTLTPPTGFSGSLGLTVTATASVNGTQASHSEALTVSVAAVADAPTLSVTAASGSEDQAIALSISGALVSPAAGEVLSIVIAGVPAGAVLSAGSDNGDGTWTLSVADLSGLTLTPPADFSGSLGLTVTATASVNGTQASHSEALTVNVAAVADAPTLSVAAASGVEDQAIALSISGALVSPAAGEVLSIVIAGVPAGAVLSAGSDNGDGTWTLSVADLSGLTLTPPTGFSGSLGLTVTATASVNGTQASHSEALTVSVAAVADAPTLSVTAASGSEDQAIALSISGALVSPAAGEVLSIVIAGVPAGAVLSAGSDNGDGTWTLSVADLSGLTLTPPADFSGSLGLTVTATASVNGTQASHSEALTVNVAAVADAPTLSVAAASGSEDQAIALSISGALVSPAAGEVLSIVIAGVPAGAVLSAGIHNSDGTWTLTAGQLSGLTLTPPTGFSGSLGLTVTATASVNGTQASHSEALTVSVAAVADAPTLSVTAASGSEDQAIALSISGALVSPAAGEVLSVVIAGVPAGAVLSAGSDNGDGTWTLSVADLSGLTLTPPADFSGSLGLTVTATASVNGTQASHSEALTVNVAAVADAPTLSVAAASGSEDQAIALSISGALVSPAAGEVLSIVIAGVPAGAVLSAGIHNSDGTWTLTAGQLSGLTLTPPTGFSGSLGLTVTATASVNGTQASHSEALTVSVAAVADAPTLSVAAASGSEDQAIALSISGALVSPAAGEVLSVVIAGVPAGAVLSAGSDNGDGTWTLTVGQLSGLTLTPPSDFSGSLGLTVTATASVNGTQASHSEALTVSVAAVADAPTLSVTAASGSEDQAIALSISGALVSPAAGEVLSIVIAGVPAGAVLSAGSDNGDGTWTLSVADLSGLTLTPPADFSGSLGLTVTATASVNGTQASHSEALTVNVAAVADAPTLSVAAASGSEDQAIALSISGALVSPAAGEVLSIVIAGVPAGAVLSAGSDNGDGTWTLSVADLSGLTLTPPADFSGSLGLTVTATASVNGTQASHSEALTVNVAAVADAPTLSVAAASGSEDQAIALSISGALVSPAAGEVLSVVIAGVPAGAVLSAGSDNGDGTWTLTAGQLSGLTLTPPTGFSGSLGLTVTATASVNGTQASHSEALTVSVAAVADAPTLSVAAASGVEDQAIALSISGALVSPAAGEVLSVVIAGVPAGAVLSAGIHNSDGTWTLTVGQLSGLTLTPPSDFSGSLGLTVTATSSVNGTQASHSEALTVSVAAVADAPTLSVAAASGSEDQAIALSISGALVSAAAGEVLSVVIAGVPAGAVLSAGSDNGDGTWTLSVADLSGLTLTPPTGFSGSLGLTVTATASVNGTQASHSEALTVSVAAVADAPSLAVLPAYGLEDHAIGLGIAARLADIDGSESLSLTISGVPTGAVLSAGINNGNGSWTLTGAQLSGLTLTPPHNYSGTIGLTVTARATEATGGSATTTLSLPVSVTGVADTPTLSVSAASGVADTAIGLNIAAALQDTDLSETLSVRISGVPAGARLSHGLLTSSAGGFTVWTLAAGDLAGLTITPPCHYTGVMDLTVRAVATESDGDSATGAASHLMVTVAPSGAGASAGVNLNLGVVAGVEDTPVTLNLLGSLTGLLGSATLDSVVVTGVGNATLSAGLRLQDGSYLLTPAQLLGLKLIPPLDVSGDYTLGATVNLGGSQLGTSVTATLGVHVVGAADAPTLSVAAAAGAYASAIPLSITGALTDTSGTEHLHYILNLATGAHLSAGINNGDGTWTVLPSQLAGLTVTPPYGFSGSLPITVTAVSQEAGGAVASVSKVLGVTVAAPTAGLLAALAGLVPLNGVEDVALDLGSTLLALNLGSIATVSIGGLPSGATLSSGGLLNISANNIGVSVLSGLKLNMPSNYSGDFQLTATVKLIGGLITLNKDINVHVAPVVDLPTLTVGATINGTEDQAIGLNIAGGLVDLDGSEALSFTIAGVPAGVRLSAGHVNPVSGAWTLTAAELVGLKLLPPPDYSGTITLSIGSVATELLGGAGVTLKPLTINIAPVTDTPLLALPTAVGSEDSAIPLTIGVAAGDIDGSETITGVVVSGLPAGATLNHGTALGNGSYSLTTADLVGLTITPPANYAGTLALTVTATAKDGSAASASASGSLSVTVKPVADAPTLTVADCTGHQGHDIALSIGASLVDTDASEVLSVVVAGLPAGAVLSAGLNNGDGTWTLTGAQLAGLKLHTAAGFSGDVNLTVTAHALDGGIGPCNQSLADSTATMTVHVQPEIAPPHLALANVTLLENTSVLLDLGVGLHGLNILADLSVTVAGLPVGASLSAGTHNQDGSWTIQAAQLAGLRLTPPADSSADFTLTVTASAHAAGLAAVETTGSLHVTVLPDLGDTSLLHAGFAIAPALGLSVLGTQIVAGATITLDSGFHSGDHLTLGGLHTETDASGHLLIAGTGIQVTGGGYDAQNHTLTLSGNASASVYESVLRAIHLDPSNDGGSRSIAIDLFDGNGQAMALGHQAITLDVGLDGSATGTVLGGVLGLVDGTLGGLGGAGLGLDLGSLGDALTGHTDGGASSTPVDDHLHNATNYLHA